MSTGCGCSGDGSLCCGGKSSRPLNRRQFIQSSAVAAGGLSLLASGQAHAGEEQRELTEQHWKTWNEQLLERGDRRRYTGAELERIAMPMGGIGAGQVFITGKGKLEQWQIVNNFNEDANVAGAFFAVWARQTGKKAVAKVLQMDGYEQAPGITAIEFSGEYPFAWLNYMDEELPVQVELEAFSPFIPANSKDSGLPAVAFRFQITNPTNSPVETSILASIPNLVGWDGYGELAEGRHHGFVANENTLTQDGQRKSVHMTARSGKADRLSRECALYTNDRGVAYALGQCSGIKALLDPGLPKAANPASSVYWIGDLSSENQANGLPHILEAVREGASLIIAGEGDTLLALADADSENRAEEVVIENWEKGTYDGWTVEGDAFGESPAPTKLPGARGQFLVDTAREGDLPTGRVLSKPFKISHRFVHLLVAGGDRPGQECVNLKVGNKIVATATGKNTHNLQPVRWDVSAHIGLKGVIEIVDSHTSDWGHFFVDDILFSNSPASPFLNRESARLWRDAMPMNWKSLNWISESVELDPASELLQGMSESLPRTAARWDFEELQLKPGARVALQTRNGAPLVVEGPCGKGKIVVCVGGVHQWFADAARKQFIGNTLAMATGAEYHARTGWEKDDVFYGSMALSALDEGEKTTALPQWQDFASLWADFSQDGLLDESTNADGPSLPGTTWNTALSVPVTLAPGEKKHLRFVLNWHFPNRMRDFRYGLGPPPPQYDFRLGNQYNNWFDDAAGVAEYVSANYEKLDAETRAFHDTFYDSTLPRWMLDGITANISTIRSPIIMWLEDGTVAGFEGSDACCPMNCTHVYNYAMAIAFLFPDLEQRMREIDILNQMHKEGHFIPHRTLIPLSLPRLGNEIAGPFHHALDGELGTVLKLYREYRQCGDTEWLKTLWPNTKLVMEHVLRDHDAAGDGVIRGEQPNTYDTHAFGSNTFIGSMYLAALLATEHMANVMGDPQFAQLCRTRFEKGAVGYDQTCWNGEYYYNVYDAPGATPETYNDENCWGPGCHSDQLLGQWWAHIAGLEYVLPPERVKQALESVYKHNWRQDMSGHIHSQRVFAEGNEMGLLCCTWPRGGRPEKPIKYCDEVWTGIEYEVAALMLWNGMTREGLHVAKGARDRYTGIQRNPWCEIECGGHYARAMAAYSLLLAASGFDADAAEGRLSFAPQMMSDDFKSFFSLGSCWGGLVQKRDAEAQLNRVELAYGSLELKQLSFELPPSINGNISATITTNRGPLQARTTFSGQTCTVVFDTPISIRKGDYLAVQTQ